MIIIKSIFSRLTILCILIIYSKRGLVPRVSCSYISDSGDSYWNPRLITLEALMYPLGVNLYEFISALEADVTLNNLKPSEHFTPLIHNRKELLCTIQEMMHERTGSDHCRKDLSVNLNTSTTLVGSDFRSTHNSISIMKLEKYACAAGIPLSEVLRRYYEKYSNDPAHLDYESYPVAE